MKELTPLKNFLKEHSLAALLLLALSLIVAAKFFVFRLIPSVDLPNHLAVATIIKYAAQSVHHFNAFFEIDNILKPGTFHPWFCALPIFPAVEFGNRVLLFAYAILLPISVFLLLCRVGGNPWFALLSIVLVQNFNLHWGFIGYTIALPVILLTHLASLRYFDTTNPRWAALTGTLLVLLFFMHAQALLFSIFVFLLCSVYRNRSAMSRWAMTGLVLLPSTSLIVWWWLTQPPSLAMTTPDMLRQYYSGDFFTQFPARFGDLLALDNYSLFAATRGVAVAYLIALIVIAITVWGFIRRGRASRELVTAASGMHITLFAVAAITCYLFLPPKLPGQEYLYQRFSVLVLLSLILLGSCVAGKRLHMIMKTLIVVVALGSTVLWYDYYNEFNRANRSFDKQAFPWEAPDIPVSGMVFDYAFRGHPMYVHCPNYHIVWNRGIMAAAFVDYRFGIVRSKVGIDTLPHANTWIGRFPTTYRAEQIGTRFVVFRGQPHESIKRVFDGLELIRAQGHWTLYRQLSSP